METFNGILILCSTAADIQHAVTLVDQHKGQNIILGILHRKAIYEFVKSLKLPACKVIYLSTKTTFSPSFYKIWENLRLKNQTKKIFQTYLHEIINWKIYFFAIDTDWLLFYFLYHLRKHNALYYIRNGRIPGEIVTPKTIPLYLLRFWMRFITDAPLELRSFDLRDAGAVIALPDADAVPYRQITNIVNENVLEPYLHVLVFGENPNRLLFIDVPLDEFTLKHDATTKTLIELFLSLGFEVFVKPHPRLGLTPCIATLPVKIIPAYIPNELVDLSGFNFVIANASTALCHVSWRLNDPKKCLSVLNIFHYKSERDKNHFRKILTEGSRNQLTFIDSIDQLTQTLRSPSA